MNIQKRIEDLSTMGRTRTILEVNSLINDGVKAISEHFAIPEEDIVKVLEDSL